MIMYDLETYEDTVNGKNVVVLQQSLIDYTRENYRTNSIQLSLDQIPALVKSLTEVVDNKKEG